MTNPNTPDASTPQGQSPQWSSAEYAVDGAQSLNFGPEVLATMGNQDPLTGSQEFETAEERLQILEEQVDALREQLTQLQQSVAYTPTYQNPFLGLINGTTNKFTEALINNGTVSAVASPPWRSGTVVPLQNGTAGKQTALLQVMTPKGMAYVDIGGGASGFKPVLVKADGGGSNGPPCSLTYNVYELADTSLVTPILSGVQPECSRARINAVFVFKAPDGTSASAYYGADGILRLFDCQEYQNDAPCSP